MHTLTALCTCNMCSTCSDFVHAPRMLTAYFNLCTPHLKERKRESVCVWERLKCELSGSRVRYMCTH